MSSYGDDFSDEERNYTEQGSAAQGESDIEESGPGEGERVIDLCQNRASGSDGGVSGSGVTGDAVNGGASVFGAAKSADLRANAEVGGNQGDLNAFNSEWGIMEDNDDAKREMGNLVSEWNNTWAISPPAKLPIGDILVTDFCERLKLFRSPDVTILVGPEEVLFTIPKEILCLNSAFFDRALNGKFKEGVEQVIRLPEDTVMAFQMMLQWIYTGNIRLPNHISANFNPGETTGFFLEFFKLADKIELLEFMVPIVDKFRAHLQSPTKPNGWTTTNSSDCNEACRMYANETDGWSAPCSCHNSWHHPAQGHDYRCRTVYYNCPSMQAHIDSLRSGIITPDHIHMVFELRSGHGARKVMAQACAISYLMSGTLDFEFRFAAELKTVDGFCHAILDEVAGILVKDGNMIDPLKRAAIGSWPPNMPTH